MPFNRPPEYDQVPERHRGPLDIPTLGWLAMRARGGIEGFDGSHIIALQDAAAGKTVAESAGSGLSTTAAAMRAEARKLLWATSTSHAVRIAIEANLLSFEGDDPVYLEDRLRHTLDWVSRGYAPKQLATVIHFSQRWIYQLLERAYPILGVVTESSSALKIDAATIRAYETSVFRPLDAWDPKTGLGDPFIDSLRR
jgi:hypothetical protein